MKKGIALALSTLTLIGCGAGGSGDGHTAIQDRRVQGVWDGEVTFLTTDPQIEYKLMVAVDSNHQSIWYIYEEENNTVVDHSMEECDISRIGRSFKCTLTSALTIEGITHASELTMSGDGLISGVEYQSFKVDLNTNYDKEANLSNLEGIWSNSGNTLALTFNEDGTFTGQAGNTDNDDPDTPDDPDAPDDPDTPEETADKPDDANCSYTGTVEIINTTKSLFNLNLELETCNTLDGTYTGKLFYENTGDEDDPDETITLLLLEVGDDPENLQRFSLELDKN